MSLIKFHTLYIVRYYSSWEGGVKNPIILYCHIFLKTPAEP